MHPKCDFRPHLALAAMVLPRLLPSVRIGSLVAHASCEELIPDPRSTMTSAQMIDEKLSANLGKR
jgi:hypothetical protein